MVQLQRRLAQHPHLLPRKQANLMIDMRDNNYINNCSLLMPFLGNHVETYNVYVETYNVYERL